MADAAKASTSKVLGSLSAEIGARANTRSGNTDSKSISKRKRQDVESPTKTKAKKRSRGYAAPETYAHLGVLQDYLAMELDVMFCGINPGCVSAETGHHFAHHSNHFWSCLHQSGMTNRLLAPSEDHTLPESFNLGLTNLVDRPSAEQAELSPGEMTASAPALLRKVSRYRPRIVCFVGKAIWLSVERTFRDHNQSVRNPKAITSSPRKQRKTDVSTPDWGLQPYKMIHIVDPPDLGGHSRSFRIQDDWKISHTSAFFLDNTHILRESVVKETLFFVVPSTSARVVGYQLKDKIIMFESLRKCVENLKDGKIDTEQMTTVTTPSNIPFVTTGVSRSGRKS